MKIKKRNFIDMIIVLSFLLNIQFFNIIKLPVKSVYFTYLSWIIVPIGIAAFFSSYRKTENEYKYLKGFLTYSFLVQIVISIYSIFKYKESLFDMFICAGAYLLLYLTVFVLFSFEKNGMFSILNKLFYIQFFYMILILIHAVIYNYTKISLFAFPNENVRDGRLRIYAIGAFSGFFFIYAFYNALKFKKRNFMLVAIILGMICIFYVEMSRVRQISIIITLFSMWFFDKKLSKKTIYRYILLISLFILFVNSSYFNYILSALSMNYDINEKANSTIARYNAIEYFFGFFKANPIFGMGYVRPYTYRLTRIWSGPYGVYFLDDLGFLGQLFRSGILGAAIYIILIVRMVYILIKIKNNCAERALLIGILVYVCSTAISLNCFDGLQILAVPIYIACFEYVYKKSKNEVETLNTV